MEAINIPETMLRLAPGVPTPSGGLAIDPTQTDFIKRWGPRIRILKPKSSQHVGDNVTPVTKRRREVNV
jgi:hypothetical protein